MLKLARRKGERTSQELTKATCLLYVGYFTPTLTAAVYPDLRAPRDKPERALLATKTALICCGKKCGA